jgi:hypothetical protein
MIAQMPALLALLGTALMAIVIFAPQVRPAGNAVSFAPPLPELVPDRAPYAAPDDPPPPLSPSWPGLVDPRAGPCDPQARLALVDALAAVRRPWAAAILARAFDDDDDARVRDAIARTLEGLSP